MWANLDCKYTDDSIAEFPQRNSNTGPSFFLNWLEVVLHFSVSDPPLSGEKSDCFDSIQWLKCPEDVVSL